MKDVVDVVVVGVSCIVSLSVMSSASASRFAHLDKFSSSFVIRVNLLHP